MSDKKITKIDGSDEQSTASRGFVPTEESKGKATQLRMFAALSWLGAFGAQIWAITFLFKQPQPENFMTWMIALIVVDLAFAILGSYLWKKSNRLDPASEKNKFMFFM